MAVAWLAALSGGFLCLVNYSTKPAKNIDQLDCWPETTALAFGQGEYTLVMFVHPRCPCTKASLNQLERVIDRVGKDRVDLKIVVFRPAGKTADWSDTHLRKKAEQLTANVFDDLDAQEAKKFEVNTSGYLLCFNKEKQRIFGGGITGSRGHEGENRGADSIVCIMNRKPAEQRFPVFGCQIWK